MTLPALELNFHRIGIGPPIVILHGLFGSARNWQSIARKLTDNFEVITVDLRNHGSSPHAAEMAYTDLAADVSALIEKLELQDVTLIGHSMGGKAAMTLALAKPSQIGRLIVVDIGPGSYDNDYGHMLDAMSALDLSVISRRAEALAQLERAIPDNEIRLFILQNLKFDADARPRWRINLPVIRAEIDNLVGAISYETGAHFDRPCYFIKGENSTRVNENALTLINRCFPGHRLITIANAGHWPHVENPLEFLNKLREILAQKSG